MKKIILVIVVFFSLVTFGQTPVDNIVFYDSIGKETLSKNYVSKQIIKEFNLEKSSYEVERYSRINDFDILNSKFFVSDKFKLIKNGVETSYYDTGEIEEIINYENGKPIDAKSWYKNGKSKLEMRYFFDVNEKQYNNSIDNYWDSDNVQKVKDGNGEYQFNLNVSKDAVYIKGNVFDGKLVGKWNTQPDVYPYFEEYYSKGKLLNGVRKKSKSESKYYTEISIQTKPIDGMNEFRKLIGSKIKTKKQKASIDGTVIAKFIVDENGKIQNPVIVKSLNEYFDNQLIDILKNSEKWTPGSFRGVSIKTYFTLPVRIKVEQTN